MARPLNDPTLGAQLVLEIEEKAKSLTPRLTQAELLKRAGVTKGTAFNSWKRGLTSPQLEKLQALCEVIGECLTVSVEPPMSAAPRGSANAGGSHLFEESRKIVALMQTIKDPARRKEVLSLAQEYVQAWGPGSPRERAAD
jgi:transcriptional regulator with XRE-family HTH domain